MSADRPLATFFLQTYEQEKYVRQAVLSALAQTYSPMEILISDDGSTDGTFAVIEETVAGYKGPHEIRLNRNPERLYFHHLDRVIPMIRGRYVVWAAGDDVSMPQRTEKVMRAWAETGADAINSSCVVIDAEGKPQGITLDPQAVPDVSLSSFLVGPNVMCHGASLSWSRATWETFGPMPKVRNQDWQFPFWALLMGGNHFINEPLVAYRIHGGNVALGLKKPDTEEGKLLLREAQACQRVGSTLAFLDAVARLRTLRPDDPRPDAITPALQQRLRQETREWTDLRHEIGQRHIGVF